MAADAIAYWSPDGAPNRWHLLFAASIAVWASWSLVTTEATAWHVAAVGFVTFAIASGPVAASPIGSRVGAWFRRIGYAGRAIAIVGFAVAIWAVVPLSDVSAARVSSFGLGGMLGAVAIVVVEAIRSRVTRDQ